MTLAQQLTDALPEIAELHGQGWTVKLTLRATLTEQAPHPFLVTLWRPVLGKGVQAGGATLAEALAAAQVSTIWKMTRRMEKGRG